MVNCRNGHSLLCSIYVCSSYMQYLFKNDIIIVILFSELEYGFIYSFKISIVESIADVTQPHTPFTPSTSLLPPLQAFTSLLSVHG